jgi:phytoene dehydrogenase-like protein
VTAPAGYSGKPVPANDGRVTVPEHADVVVVGAGHNGLVAATLLARAGLRVVVLEAAGTVGGAARTERPFRRAPELRQSTGAYLLGLMPPELIKLLGLDLPLVRRDPHYFLPSTGDRYLIFGSDRTTGGLSDADQAAERAMQEELAALREDVAPAWLAEPFTVEETADRYVRPGLRETFVNLCRGSVTAYLDRFGFGSELVTAMYAVTDGLSGVNAGPDDPGTGHNFLVHNMGRLPGSDGTWMIVRGGMGTIAAHLADAAFDAGAWITVGTPVHRILLTHAAVSGVALADGREVRAEVVLGACDPFRLATLVGLDALPEPLRARLDRLRRPGTTLKVNLALAGLPAFRCLPEGTPDVWGATIHLLPDSDRPLDAIRAMWADVCAGRLPDWPTIEWYVHTTVDPSLSDSAGRHSSALFVQSVPYDIEGSTWEAELAPYVERLLAICDRFAPGTSGLVADTFALPPPGIERHFGISQGHIHHVDNTFAFADRMPYITGVDGLYAGSAGCHPAGSVIGAAGHNAARRIAADLDVRWSRAVGTRRLG